MKNQSRHIEARNVSAFVIVSQLGERIINAISEQAASQTFLHMFGNVAHIIYPKK